MQTIWVGQGVVKDCIMGDRMMNRYGIFNGIERVRRIDNNLTVSILGYDVPAISAVTPSGAGSLVIGQYYAYKAVYASSKYLRPVAVADGSGAYTRGNGTATAVAAQMLIQTAMNVVIAGTAEPSVTTIFLYRSLGASTSAAALAGPFYYVGQAANAAGNVTINDTVADSAVGLAIENDNYAPNSYRYAVDAVGYLFAGGNLPIGTGYTCTVTPGSSLVTLSMPILYDGVRGWSFKCMNDATGGANGAGLYYANYVNSNTIQLVDGTNTAMNYNGSLTGAGKQFTLYLPGNVLKWCKYGEPEAWPTDNTINFEGELTGIAVMPTVPYLIVTTDSPSIYVLDLTLIGSYSFKTQKRLISSEFSASSHYSLISVDGKLRGIDARRKCIFETDGVSVYDQTKNVIPDIWHYLENDANKIKNWHCAYDAAQHLFGAFVTFHDAHRVCDFCVGQNTITGGWFFNFEKDLLCTGNYTDPATNELMVLGGTEGVPTGGATWGRIWCPGVYDEWFPTGTLKYGHITGATATTITVDNSAGVNLYTGPGQLAGRWVLVCDANGENAQMAYVQSNTANQMVIDSVVNGIDPTQFSPVPVAGWHFYIGLIEMRWGPKRFDFDDPDLDKKVLEIQLVISEYDPNLLPFIRTYRGFESGYTRQHALIQASHEDRTYNQGLYHRTEAMLGSVPRWGVAVYDRSYGPTALRNVTIIYRPAGAGINGDQ
jgi:hypothetical protein